MQSSQPVFKKKRKRSSPFRIKVGCVVALRYRNDRPCLSFVINNDEQNGSQEHKVEQEQRQSLNFDSFVRVWTSPVAGRDEGLALIGKRVRCHLPKIEPTQKRRVLEGEITRLVDFDSENTKKLVAGRPLKVELLIDEKQLQHFSFLKRVDYVDPATLTTETAKRHYVLEESIRGPGTAIVLMKLVHPACMSTSVTATTKSATATAPLGVQWAVQKLVPAQLFWESSKRNANLQQSQSSEHAKKVASGEGGGLQLPTCNNGGNGTNGGTSVEAMVVNTTTATATHTNGTANTPGKFSPQMLPIPCETASTLPTNKTGNSSTMSSSRKSTTSSSRKKKDQHAAVVRNVGKKNNQHAVVVRHVGDGNDSPEQQIYNWRWLASRYHDMLHSSLSSSIRYQQMTQIFSGGFVGEVLKVESCTNVSTLARVTIQRLILPEHTISGRLPHHGLFDIFDDYDSIQSHSALLIEVPIEHLIIVARRLSRLTEANERSDSRVSQASQLDHIQLSYSYSFRDDLFRPLWGALDNNKSKNDLSQEEVACHRCRQVFSGLDLHTTCASDQCPLSGPYSSTSTAWCNQCLKTFDALFQECRNRGEDGSGGGLPCCLGICDCRRCRSFSGSELHEDLEIAIAEAAPREVPPSTSGLGPDKKKAPIFERTLVTVRSILDPIDFGLPSDFLDHNALPKPQVQPSSRVKSRAFNKRSGGRGSGTSDKKLSASASRETNGTKVAGTTSAQEQLEDYSVFRPTCARLLSYLDARRHPSKEYSLSSSSCDRPRNLRQAMLEQKKKDTEKDEKASFRAVRANQRRLLKDVAAIGSTSWLGVDTLASREPQLRFDRSSIHAWGVYADEDISADEMIIEYRGEVIENAMAEKREKEYTLAKIGSDYMFRIDAQLVCDATKQGNVARFINASCDPNCYTKIITVDGNKRIVIYAKRDIRVGEELCYDYKFPLEYDETKHIPCHCGAKDCRGFMNWDKRYALPVHCSSLASSENCHASKPDPTCNSHVSFERPTPSPLSATKRAAEEMAYLPAVEKRPRSLSPTKDIDST